MIWLAISAIATAAVTWFVFTWVARDYDRQMESRK